MSKIFDGIYLFSDIDGTLGRDTIGIPQKNIEAIKRFILNGGTFGVATGRYLSDLINFVKDVPINGYSLINNGACIYNFSNKEFLYNKTLPDNSLEYFKYLAKNNLDWGLIAVNDLGYLNVLDNNLRPKINYPDINIEELKGPFYKFLFTVNEKLIKNTVFNLNQNPMFKDVYFVQTGDTLFEMTLKSISKGSALQFICNEKNIPIENTFFIGDSFNDEEIMKVSGTSACTIITDDYLKKFCKFVAGTCEDGAVAKFIDYIEKIKKCN